MYKDCSSRVGRAVVVPVLVVAGMMLSGCAGDSSFSFSGLFSSSKTLVNDYSSVECKDIWLLKDEVAFENSSYWLQMMHCTTLLSTKEIQLLLNRTEKPDSSVNVAWPQMFRRSILLSYISGSESEHRVLLDKLGQASKGVSTPLQNLIKIWIRNQQLQMSLNIERSRYQRLKENSEAHIKILNDELQAIQIKLQNLTHIETKLSNRALDEGLKSKSLNQRLDK